MSLALADVAVDDVVTPQTAYFLWGSPKIGGNVFGGPINSTIIFGCLVVDRACPSTFRFMGPLGTTYNAGFRTDSFLLVGVTSTSRGIRQLKP